MLKLQIVLEPPSVRNGPIPFGFASSTADSSQVMAAGSLYGSGGPRNADTSLPFPSNFSAANTTLYPSHFAQLKRRKFLHFTRSSNTLLDLSTEIAEKCEKMYPSLTEEIEILSLQDSSGCDLDPDFYVKDVFNIDNTVRVILKNELDIDESAPVSLYRSRKKKKLNNGLGQSQMQSQAPANSAQSLPPASSSSTNGGILQIAKKRASGTIKRHPINSNMRISTPLAHQIYPPPSTNRVASNNSDEEDVAERSFLPPPAQPQSPPIRISSGIEKSKRIRSAMDEDTVSRSETVDPDKTKQQRLLSGTPVRPAMTPNRVTLTGQRVVSEHVSNSDSRSGSIFATNSTLNNKANGTTSTRIVSGMLSIPEPRIAEIEKELREGPSSPATLLPAVPDRIPMKEPYQKITDQVSDESSSDEQGSDAHGKVSALRQTSIADNGSPVKDSSHGEDHLRNVHLADLPVSRSPSVPAQRKTSLEAKVENKSAGALAQSTGTDEPLRKLNFSEEEEEEEGEEEEQEVKRREDKEGSKINAERKTAQRSTDGEDEEGENTVLITRNDTEDKSTSNSSIQKAEFLKLMENESNELPLWLQDTVSKTTSKSKPYTTVLHKDIDNSKPDPRNIMPKHTPRSAAKKAAQLLSGKQNRNSNDVDTQRGTASSSSSDIETASSLDDDYDDKISIKENNSIKTLNLHPLKERVISEQESKSPVAENQQPSQSTDLSTNGGIDRENGIVSSQKPPASDVNTELATNLPHASREKPDAEKSFTKTSNEPVPENKSLNLRGENRDGKGSTNMPDSSTQESSGKSHLSNTSSGKPEKLLPSESQAKLTKKQEAEIKRREREAARAAKLEAAQKLKAEKEAMKIAKQKAKEEAKLAREAEAAKKKLERENKKKMKLDEARRKKHETATKKNNQASSKINEHENPTKPQSTPLQDGADRLKELKAKFTKSRAYVPAGLVPQKISRSNHDSESDSIETSSDDSSSSSDEEDSAASKKSRRLIVDTPKGSLSSVSPQKPVKHLPGVEDVPQSTQQTSSSTQETPNKIPVTRLMDMSSPNSTTQESSGRSSFLQGLPQKVRPSLSSLSDLVSRGVPDVREKSAATSQVNFQKAAESSSDDSNDEDEDSVSETSNSDSDNSSTDGSSFISAKSASTALGKKKRGSGGFASLLKDSRKA
ncbi:hypothetical protein HG536_0F01750 [Torulaspora globosa]|uniref:Nucleolar protein Dnt1-like N-terminal domain-containing protein n=1 Tax=Torulaspora globosa TaxID=48254 RepID=A0A7G3ZK14_9SACH|nr:uncharacterized protein HG536_0F01750 [Torulaspora globosa]QLL33850.1 hypothetical protein HG536_0F01750 [Torulaspora globosa]